MRKRLTEGERAVLGLISSHGGTVRMSCPNMAREAGYSLSGVEGVLRRLRSWGAIGVTDNKRPDRGAAANTYMLTALGAQMASSDPDEDVSALIGAGEKRRRRAAARAHRTHIDVLAERDARLVEGANLGHALDRVETPRQLWGLLWLLVAESEPRLGGAVAPVERAFDPAIVESGWFPRALLDAARALADSRGLCAEAAKALEREVTRVHDRVMGC